MLIVRFDHRERQFLSHADAQSRLDERLELGRKLTSPANRRNGSLPSFTLRNLPFRFVQQCGLSLCVAILEFGKRLMP